MEQKRYTLRCAVYIFLIQNGKLFLLRRKNTGWEDGKYGIPAGHLESNETVTQAVVREAKEEAGIDINIKDLTLVHTMHRKSNSEYISLFFTIDKWKREPKNNEKNKADDAKWFSIDNLPENMLEHVKLAFENYQKNILFSEFGF